MRESDEDEISLIEQQQQKEQRIASVTCTPCS